MTIPKLPFYHIRHGETDWNARNQIMGHTDIPLNQSGINQAHEAASIIKHLKFEKIWSSPLLRARQTAEIIGGSIGAKIEFNDLLKERGWGVGEGETHKHFLPDMTPMNKVTKSSESDLPKGAETYEEFEERVIRAFKEILMSSQKPPLVVSHGGVFRVLTTLLAKDMMAAKNCDLYFFKPPETLRQNWDMINLTESEFDVLS